MPAAEAIGIFVSYRRQDSSHLAGRLYDRMAGRFGEGRVFMDADTIEPGVDFVEEINRAVAACRVLLVIIGSNWLTATDERGRRRLDDPNDFVRREIEAAFDRGGVRVIPILADGAVMPGEQDLPESLAGLARRIFGTRVSVPMSVTWSRWSSGCWPRCLAPPRSLAPRRPGLSGDLLAARWLSRAPGPPDPILTAPPG